MSKLGGQTTFTSGNTLNKVSPPSRVTVGLPATLVTKITPDGFSDTGTPYFKRELISFDNYKDAKAYTNLSMEERQNFDLSSVGAEVVGEGSSDPTKASFKVLKKVPEDKARLQKAYNKKLTKINNEQTKKALQGEGGKIRDVTFGLTNEKKTRQQNNQAGSVSAGAKAEGKARKKYPTLQYPSFIEKSSQDKLKITILKPLKKKPEPIRFKPEGFMNFSRINTGLFDAATFGVFDLDRRGGGFLQTSKGFFTPVGGGDIYGLGRKSGKQNESFSPKQQRKIDFGKRSIGHITLPVPNGVTDQNKVDFGAGTLNPLQKAASDVALKAMLDSSKAAVSDAGKFLKSAVKDKQTRVGLSNLVAATAIGVDGNELLARTNGSILNNNLQLLFKTPTLRQFTFQFNLSPRDATEAGAVKQIIRALKQSSAAQRSSGGENFLVAPNTYRLQFLTAGNVPHSFLPRPKECALLAVSVNYMPENSYMTYPDTSMVVYTLSLSFQEITPIFNNDFTEEDGDKDEFIGF